MPKTAYLGKRMAELYLARHAQASFGADNYDVLSDLGHAQSFALGQAIAAQGLRPDLWVIGDLNRHRETLEGIQRGMGMAAVAPEIHAGLNEFDFTGLLNARFGAGSGPKDMHSDRKTHFKTLRETVLAWQRDEITDPPESWAAFTQRIEAARQFIMRDGPSTVLTVSSGGPIGQMVASVMQSPPDQQIKLQLQVKNCSLTRFIFTQKACYLHGFNETPHITAETHQFLTYS